MTIYSAVGRSGGRPTAEYRILFQNLQKPIHVLLPFLHPGYFVRWQLGLLPLTSALRVTYSPCNQKPVIETSFDLLMCPGVYTIRQHCLPYLMVDWEYFEQGVTQKSHCPLLLILQDAEPSLHVLTFFQKWNDQVQLIAVCRYCLFSFFSYPLKSSYYS